MLLRPPRSTRTDTLLPYTPLFRSDDMRARRHPDGAALAFSRALNRLEDDEFENEAGLTPRKHAPLDFFRTISPEERDRKSTRLNSSHSCASRMPSSA